jgi:hypothetical protein
MPVEVAVTRYRLGAVSRMTDLPRLSLLLSVDLPHDPSSPTLPSDHAVERFHG